MSVLSVRFFQIKRTGSPTQFYSGFVPKYCIPCLNLAWIVAVRNWYTGRPLACRAGPLELTVLHTLHSLLPDILRNVPWDLFFPQRSSLEWQIASCHKVENINTARQKLRSEASDTQGGKWIRLHLILCDISSHGFTILSVQTFCWLTPGFFPGHSALSKGWNWSFVLLQVGKPMGLFPLAQN